MKNLLYHLASKPVLVYPFFRDCGRKPFPPSLLLFFAIALLLSSCANPVRLAERAAVEAGLHREEITGDHYSITFFSNEAAQRGEKATLHLYFAGDGTPWINHRWKAKNPTPRRPMVFSLLAQERGAAAMVGRPCYHQCPPQAGCRSELWTSARYSPVVIEEMRLAILRYLQRYPAQRLVLIGRSGGGVLAAALARQLPDVAVLVTICANYDISAWTAYHGWSPLTGSLNAADLTPLGKDIRQLHLLGEEDAVVPPALMADLFPHGEQVEVRIVEEFSHLCCWAEIWQEILDEIEGWM